MSETEQIETKDYWTIIALEACGHVAEKISVVDNRDNKSKLLIYHFSNKAATHFDAWVRGETREPFDAVRKVQNSQRQFKATLNRLST